MDDPRRSFEFRQLDQADKIRLVVVGFLGFVLLTAPASSLSSMPIACVTLGFAALYAIYTRFVINWRSIRSEGHVHLMVGLIAFVDVLYLSVFIWAAGPNFVGLSTLLMLDVVLAASFFQGIELAFLVGIVCIAYATLGFAGSSQHHMWQAITGAGATVVLAWMAYALAEVARRERATTDRIVRYLSEGVLMVTEDWHLAVVNPRAEHMFGVEESKLLGLDIRDPANRSALAPLADLLADISAGPRAPDDVRMRDLHVDDPNPLDIQAVTVPCAARSGDVKAWVVVCRDVTEAYGVVRGKQEGMAFLAHELRGRLQGLRAISEVLIMPPDVLASEARDEALRLLDSGTRRMTRLIARILDTSAVEDKSAPFQSETVHMDLLARDVCDGLRPTATDQGVTLSLELRGEIPATRGDNARLDQVLQNLVENSLKYTLPGGEIHLTVASHGDLVNLSVSDTGCGIPAGRMGVIFEKFVRGEAGEPGFKPSGLGLGLYICREIVRRHGGDITAVSEEGVGSTFAISIPVVPSEDPAEAEPRGASPGTTGAALQMQVQPAR